MVKRRGSPDRRGMGAPSDFLSESFLLDPQQLAQRIARAKTLMSRGFSAQQAAAMLSIPLDQIEPPATHPSDPEN